MIRRARRATVRTIRRLIRPLRLRFVDWRIKRSLVELDRLRDMRVDLVELERTEFQQQTSLFIRRMAIERDL